MLYHLADITGIIIRVLYWVYSIGSSTDHMETSNWVPLAILNQSCDIEFVCWIIKNYFSWFYPPKKGVVISAYTTFKVSKDKYIHVEVSC